MAGVLVAGDREFLLRTVGAKRQSRTDDLAVQLIFTTVGPDNHRSAAGEHGDVWSSIEIDGRWQGVYLKLGYLAICASVPIDVISVVTGHSLGRTVVVDAGLAGRTNTASAATIIVATFFAFAHGNTQICRCLVCHGTDVQRYVTLGRLLALLFKVPPHVRRSDNLGCGVSVVRPVGE